MNIKMPFTLNQATQLHAGDTVFITGYIYTARDAAHKRLIDMINNNLQLPFELENTMIYYVGPSPTPPGHIIGSAGPTTSYRMDAYTPQLLELGLRGMIGKGERNREVIDSMIKNKAVYFAAIGGAAALIAESIKSVEIIAFDDLGTESIKKIYIENFPAIVAVDSYGNDIYAFSKEKYRKLIME